MKLFPFIFIFFSFQIYARSTIPKNAVAIDKAPGWKCISGYTVSHHGCKKVSIPKNAILSEDGIAWHCKDGYVPYRDSCRKIK